MYIVEAVVKIGAFGRIGCVHQTRSDTKIGLRMATSFDEYFI